MTRFHIAQIIPTPRMHGLRGYAEVIESVKWGLEQLGHRVTCDVNRFSRGARNIVFGAQVLPIDAQKQLADDSIIYNFEQLPRDLDTPFRDEIRHFAERFCIWDYSEFNLDGWDRIETAHKVRIVPVGYAPVLERIEPRPQQDIDVLIYGFTSPERLEVFNSLAKSGLTTVFACGLYGQERDELIARSKVVLNINRYRDAGIFEVVRVSYLLMNHKAVVSDLHANTRIEPDLEAAIRISQPYAIAGECLRLVDNASERSELAERGYDIFRRRDIRQILSQALLD